MTDIPTDFVGEILLKENFSIVDLVADPVTSDTLIIIIHDLHPEDEIKIKLVSTKEDGEDAMELQFEGPDVWTDEEAKVVLNEVLTVITKIVEEAVEGKDAEIEVKEEGNG